MISNKLILAKSNPQQTLIEHTKAVISILIDLYQNLPESLNCNSLKQFGILASLFHDIGKIHPEFQRLLRNEDNQWNRQRHEIFSAFIFAVLIVKNQDNIDFSVFRKEWFFYSWLTIFLHHKSIHTNLPETNTAYFSKTNHLQNVPFDKRNLSFLFEIKKLLHDEDVISNIFKDFLDLLKEYYPNMRNKELDMRITEEDVKDFTFNTFIEFVQDHKISDGFSLLTEEEINDKDIELDSSTIWMNLFISNSQVKLIPDYHNRYFVNLLLGLLKSADHIASGGLKVPPYPSLNILNQIYQPYPFQEKVANHKGSLILQAPTGSGKTNAAIDWAIENQKKNSRLIYILPYQASINAMFVRLLKITKEKNDDHNIYVGISHAKNLEFLSTYFSKDDSQESYISPKSLGTLVKELYYPIKISTAHQLLRFILFGKGWETLLLELHDSLIIFDEIHAYEPFILGLLIGLMKVLLKFNVKYLIMTATIPQFIISLVQNEVFPNQSNDKLPLLKLDPQNNTDNSILEKKRHKFIIQDGNISENIKDPNFYDLIKIRYQSKKKQLFICNTVGTAQNLYLFFKLDVNFNGDHIKLFHSRYNYRDRAEIEQSLVYNNKDKKNFILIATQVVEVSLDINYDYGYFEPAPIDMLIQRMGRVNRQGNNQLKIEDPPNIIIFSEGIHDQLIYSPDVVTRTLNVLVKGINSLFSEMELTNYVNEVYPSFNNEEQKEFSRGLNFSTIIKFEENFQIGYQQEWVQNLIEQTDSQIEVIPIESIDEFNKLIENHDYIEIQKLLISLNIRILKKEDYHLKENYYILNNPIYQYSNELGLVIKR